MRRNVIFRTRLLIYTPGIFPVPLRLDNITSTALRCLEMLKFTNNSIERGVFICRQYLFIPLDASLGRNAACLPAFSSMKLNGAV